MSRSAKPQICTDCGGLYFNWYAHFEGCPGPVKYVRPVCEARVPTSGNVRLLCSLPRGHRGGHRA